MGGRGTASNGQSSGCGGQQRLPLSRGWRMSRHIRQPACRAEASMGTQEPITRPASHVWEWTPLVLSAAGETSLIPGTRGSIRSLMQPLECQHILSLPGRDQMLFARLSVHFYLSGFHLDPSKLIQSPRGWNQEPGTRRQRHRGFSGAAPGCLDIIQGLFQLWEQKGRSAEPSGPGWGLSVPLFISPSVPDTWAASGTGAASPRWAGGGEEGRCCPRLRGLGS